MTDKKPRTIDVPICLDQDVETAARAAQHALEVTAQRLLETFRGRFAQAQALRPDEDAADVAQSVFDEDQATLAALEQEKDAAQEALRDACRVYRFQSIGWKAWRAMKAAHPSKDKDLIFDLDTLAPALLRDASLEPKLTAAAVEDILESGAWSEGEINLLLNAAITVQS